MAISDIMSTDLVVAKVTDTVGAAIRMLEDMEIRHLPVVDDGRLVGMVSDRDLREYRLPIMAELDNPERAEELLSTPLAQLMVGAVVSVDVGEPLRSVLDLMIDYKIGAVPVLDRDTEQLVGILSYIDVLRDYRERLADD